MAADLPAIIARWNEPGDSERGILWPHETIAHAPMDIATLVAEVEELRAKLTASRRQVRAAVACLTTPDTPRGGGPLRPWQIAFRLGRAGLRLDGKDHVNGTVIAEYEHPGSHYIGATIHVTYQEVGRR